MKWLGPAAMAVLIIGSCSQKDGDASILTASAPAAEVAAAGPPPSIEGIPAGDYVLDPGHSTFLFRVNHLSFSNFTMWFDDFGADLKLDPANPSAAQLTARVNPATLMSHAAPAGFLDHIKDKDFLDVAAFPDITYRSTAIKMTGPNTADVTGDLTLHGVTKPVTLQLTYNGGYAGHIYETRARIGFSGKGSFNRSDFGVGKGVPAPGTTMGTSDKVELIFETEFLGPPWKDAPKPEPQPS